MTAVILTLFCTPKLSADNDGTSICGAGVDTRQCQPTLTDVGDTAGRQAVPYFWLISAVDTPCRLTMSAAMTGLVARPKAGHGVPRTKSLLLVQIRVTI